MTKPYCQNFYLVLFSDVECPLTGQNADDDREYVSVASTPSQNDQTQARAKGSQVATRGGNILVNS